jgi:protein-tyrosine-phosphatase
MTMTFKTARAKFLNMDADYSDYVVAMRQGKKASIEDLHRLRRRRQRAFRVMVDRMRLEDIR